MRLFRDQAYDTIINPAPQGMVIGLPPVLNFGKGALQKRVLDDVFSGKKVSPSINAGASSKSANSIYPIFSIYV